MRGWSVLFFFLPAVLFSLWSRLINHLPEVMPPSPGITWVEHEWPRLPSDPVSSYLLMVQEDWRLREADWISAGCISWMPPTAPFPQPFQIPEGKIRALRRKVFSLSLMSEKFNFFYMGHLQISPLIQSLYIRIIWMWERKVSGLIWLLTGPLHLGVKIQEKQKAYGVGTIMDRQKSLVEFATTSCFSWN